MAIATSYKRFTLKTVAVAVLMTATVGVSAGDRELLNGVILGYYPTGNQDQLVDSITITATTGVVTVTLAAAATAHNLFNVVVMVRK
jgi:hypothetical protein